MTLSLARPEARVFCLLNDPKGPLALTDYDEPLEVRVTPGPSAGAIGFGIIGARNANQVDENRGCLSIQLSIESGSTL